MYNKYKHIASKIISILKKLRLFLIIGIGSSFLISAWGDDNVINDDNVEVNTVTPLEKLPDIYNRYTEIYPKCLAQLPQLAYVKLAYWGFDNKEHTGALIVNKELAQDVLSIFKKLRTKHFPIEQMCPVNEFHNSDDDSMAANNTSAFNCREVTGHPGVFSQHGLGRAIDINPKINPYVKKVEMTDPKTGVTTTSVLVLPPNGQDHVDRNAPEEGKITQKNFIYNLFTDRGWDWVGGWYDVQDNQHVEKRAYGEKRDPNGYPPPKNVNPL